MQTTQQPKIVATVPTVTSDGTTTQQQQQPQQGVLVAWFDTANLPTFAVCAVSSILFLIVSNELLPAIWSNPNPFINFLFNITKLIGAVVTFKVTESIVNIGLALWAMLKLLQRGMHKLEKRRDDQNWNKSRI